MQVTLKRVRLGSASLAKPTTLKDYPNAGPKYRARFIVEPGSAEDKLIKAAISQEMTEKFKEHAKSKLENFGSNQKCYTKGSSEYEGQDGMMILAANRDPDTKGKPGIFSRACPVTTESGKLVPGQVSAGEKGFPYPGCIVGAIVDIYAQDSGTPGIRCALVSVIFLEDGEPLGHETVVSEDTLSSFMEGADVDDPMEAPPKKVAKKKAPAPVSDEDADDEDLFSDDD